MKSKPEQFSKIILQCMEQYSKDTTVKVDALLNSHERVLQFEKIIEKNLPEQELLELLEKNFPTVE